MATPLSIAVPFPVFQDRDGQPLENGYIWLGVANLNPQTNPVIAYFDEALTIVAPQPLRTLNGYISRAGTPAQVYIDGVSFSILVQDSKGSMVYNFLDGTGISADACGVTYNPPFVGGVAYPVCEKLEQTVSVKDFGAVGDGIADDTAAIQAAINAVGIGGTVYLFGGVFKTTEELVINNPMTLEGEDSRLGNIVNRNISKSCIITDSPTDAVGILINDRSVTLRNFALVNGPTNPSIRVDGIRCNGINGNFRIYDLLIEGYQRGITSNQNYYTSITNTSIANCDIGVNYQNCYNAYVSNIKIRVNRVPVFASSSYGISAALGSQINFFGGAIESFGTGGILMGSGSSICLFGTYFEGEPPVNSPCVQVDTNGKVVAIGCHVYLTQASRFISVLSGGSTGVSVYAKNNRILYPTDSKTVEVYVPLASDQTASWDVSGDNWQSPIGPNVTYFTSEGSGGGNRVVQYPPGHPFFLKPVNQKPYVQNAWISTPTLPVSTQTNTALPTIVAFACQAFPGDDPLNIRTAGWGNYPYMAIYQKEQWEKVGTRLPNQADSTAATLADLVIDFNSLLAKMRANGIMI